MLKDRFPLLDGATAEIVAIEMQQVEGEIGEAIGPPIGDGVLQITYMRDAAIVGDGDLAVENHLTAERQQFAEGLAE